MKKRISRLLLCSLYLILTCCSGNKGPAITDESVINYCKAYKQLKSIAPDLLNKTNNSGGEISAGQRGFEDFEKALKDNGIGGYADFVKLNAKIGAIFSIMQAAAAMDQFQSMKDNGLAQIDDGMKSINEKLADASTPEQSKAELRKALEELKESKKKIENDWTKNKKWADFVMTGAKKASGMFVSEKDIEVVKRHEKEIMEAYTGITPPQPAQ